MPRLSRPEFRAPIGRPLKRVWNNHPRNVTFVSREITPRNVAEPLLEREDYKAPLWRQTAYTFDSNPYSSTGYSGVNTSNMKQLTAVLKKLGQETPKSKDKVAEGLKEIQTEKIVTQSNGRVFDLEGSMNSLFARDAATGKMIRDLIENFKLVQAEQKRIAPSTLPQNMVDQIVKAIETATGSSPSMQTNSSGPPPRGPPPPAAPAVTNNNRDKQILMNQQTIHQQQQQQTAVIVRLEEDRLKLLAELRSNEARDRASTLGVQKDQAISLNQTVTKLDEQIVLERQQLEELQKSAAKQTSILQNQTGLFQNQRTILDGLKGIQSGGRPSYDIGSALQQQSDQIGRLLTSFEQNLRKDDGYQDLAGLMREMKDSLDKQPPQVIYQPPTINPVFNPAINNEVKVDLQPIANSIGVMITTFREDVQKLLEGNVTYMRELDLNNQLQPQQAGIISVPTGSGITAETIRSILESQTRNFSRVITDLLKEITPRDERKSFRLSQEDLEQINRPVNVTVEVDGLANEVGRILSGVKLDNQKGRDKVLTRLNTVYDRVFKDFERLDGRNDERVGVIGNQITGIMNILKNQTNSQEDYSRFTTAIENLQSSLSDLRIPSSQVIDEERIQSTVWSRN